MTRVLVVGDHAPSRSGLCAALAAEPGVTLVGEAATGAQAVAAAGDCAPDVVVVGAGLPDMSGVDAVRAIVADRPGTGVLLLAVPDDTGSAMAALRAGARGCLPAGCGREEVVHAVRAVARGGAVFGAAVAGLVLGLFAPPREPFPELTAREREVLTLVAEGASNPAIAAALTVSPKTVRNHVSSIFAKLGVADRPHAIVLARRAGLGGP